MVPSIIISKIFPSHNKTHANITQTLFSQIFMKMNYLFNEFSDGPSDPTKEMSYEYKVINGMSNLEMADCR